jgi:hypothetical protein
VGKTLPASSYDSALLGTHTQNVLHVLICLSHGHKRLAQQAEEINFDSLPVA